MKRTCCLLSRERHFSLAAFWQIPALSLNTCDKQHFDSVAQYRWSNKYVWCQSQRRNNRLTYTGAADQLQVCLARKQTHVQDILGPYIALAKSTGGKQWQDASKTTSCIQRVIAFRQKTVINFCLNPFICLPTRKSPSRISWANNWLILSKLAKPLKNVLALKMVTLCNPWSRQMCPSVGATAFCTARTWLSYASTDTVNADHSRLGALSAACHGITRVSAEFFWLPGLVKVH